LEIRAHQLVEPQSGIGDDVTGNALRMALSLSLKAVENRASLERARVRDHPTNLLNRIYEGIGVYRWLTSAPLDRARLPDGLGDDGRYGRAYLPPPHDAKRSDDDRDDVDCSSADH
jgi:hypothetical protein